MGRKKGSTNKKEEVKEEVKLEVEEVKVPKVGYITDDFGREDLNRLRNKINEVIDLL